MTYSPKDAYDLSGWTPITCWQAEIVRRADLQVASGYTDVEKPEMFTEWWSVPVGLIAQEVPVLREYRDRNGCRHYLADEPGASASRDESEEADRTEQADAAAGTQCDECDRVTDEDQ